MSVQHCSWYYEGDYILGYTPKWHNHIYDSRPSVTSKSVDTLSETTETLGHDMKNLSKNSAGGDKEEICIGSGQLQGRIVYGKFPYSIFDRCTLKGKDVIC